MQQQLWLLLLLLLLRLLFQKSRATRHGMLCCDSTYDHP
jgi:hypothetical protein